DHRPRNADLELTEGGLEVDGRVQRELRVAGQNVGVQDFSTQAQANGQTKAQLRSRDVDLHVAVDQSFAHAGRAQVFVLDHTVDVHTRLGVGGPGAQGEAGGSECGC